MARGRDMQTIDLDEVDAAVAPATRPRSRRRIVAGLAVAAVVVLALLVGQRNIDAHHQAELAALAQLPGVVAPVDERLEVTRRITAEAVRSAFTPSGSLDRAADGSQSYAWRATGGALLWTTSLMGPTPALAHRPDVYAGTSCVPALDDPLAAVWDLDDVAQIVCLVTDGGIAFTDDTTVAVPESSVQLMVLSADDGAIGARWPLERGDSLTLMPGVAVVQWMEGDDTVVEAHDLATGAVRWSHRVPGTTGAPDPFQTGSVSTFGGLVTVDGTDGHFVALSADGDVVLDVMPHTDAGYVDRVIDLAGRLFLYDVREGSSSTTTLVAPDGDPAHNRTVEGLAVSGILDDGSASDLFLTSSDGLTAWDAGTGERAWSSDVDVSSVMVLAGRIYAMTGDGVVALHADTGAPAWHWQVDDAFSLTNLFTDGQHILVERDGEEPGLVALDRDSGEVDFRSRYPDVVRQLFAMDHSLLAYDDLTGGYLVVE